MEIGKQPKVYLNPLELPFPQIRNQLVISIVVMGTVEVLSGDGSRSFLKVYTYNFLNIILHSRLGKTI